MAICTIKVSLKKQKIMEVKIMTQKKLDDVQNKVGEFANKVDKKEIEIGGRKFTGLQVILFIASLVGIIACFLPFIDAEASVGGYSGSSSTNYISSHGIISIIFIVAVCALTVLVKQLIALIPAAINFLMVLYDCFFSASIHGGSDFASVDVSLKLGGYLILLAAIVILVMAVLQFLKDRKN